MKKKVCITIEEDIFKFMEENFTNKSALIETLINKYYMEKNINFKKEATIEVEELKELLE